MSNPPALLRCPFCNCQALLGEVKERDDRRRVSLQVYCSNCDAVQTADIPYNRFSKMNSAEIAEELTTVAAEKWNRRPTLDPDESRQSALDALDEADISQDGWVEDWLGSINNKYARGYLQAKVYQLNGAVGYLSEEFRECLRGFCQGQRIWSV